MLIRNVLVPLTLTLIAALAPRVQAEALLFASMDGRPTNETPAILERATRVEVRTVRRRGLFRKRYDHRYLVQVEDVLVPDFLEAGFRRPHRLWVKLHWVRVSDINGYGVGVNGKRLRTYRDALEGEAEEGFQELFALLDGAEQNWRAFTVARYPEAQAWVFDSTPIKFIERGFVVDFAANLYATSERGEEPVRLTTIGGRSRYIATR